MTDITTLADLAVAHPAAARVFYSNQLDFCCGGNREARRSVAAWLLVPGRRRLLLVLLPKPCAREMRAAMPTIHTPSTTHLHLAVSRPSLRRPLAMLARLDLCVSAV